MASFMDRFQLFFRNAWRHVSQFVQAHRVPVIVVAVLVGALVASLLIAAAAGAFAPATSSSLPPSTFRIVSVSKPDGTADAANAAVVGTYRTLTDVAGFTKSTETLLGAWSQVNPLTAGEAYIVTASRVQEGYVIRRVVRSSGYTLFSSSSTTDNFPTDATGTWTLSDGTNSSFRALAFAQ